MSEVPKKMVVTSDLEKNLIFNHLMKLKLPLRVCVNDIEYPASIERVEGGRVTVQMHTPIIGTIEGEIRTNFVFHSNYHYFASAARQSGDRQLLIEMPERIFKNMMRMYERASVLGRVYMKFRILIQARKHDFKGTSLLANERMILQEIKKPRPAVDKILNGIKTLASDFSQGFQLKIFKPGEKMSFEERIVKDTKKIFLLYDVYEDRPDEKRFLDEDVMTIGKIAERLVETGETKKTVEAKLLDLLDQKRKAGIFSECLIPLVVEGEAAGYMRLSNDLDSRRSIKPAFASKAVDYVNVLVEALVKYDYFNLKSGEEFKIPVVNISAGGLLFRLEDPRLKGYIIKGSVLLMVLLFADRQILARGGVYRMDEQDASYGVKFQEIGEEDQKYLENLVRQGQPVGD